MALIVKDNEICLSSKSITGTQSIVAQSVWQGDEPIYLQNGQVHLRGYSIQMPDDVIDRNVIEFTVMGSSMVIVRNAQGVACTFSIPSKMFINKVESVMRVAGGAMLIHDGQFAVDENNEYVPLGTVDGKLALDIIPDGMEYAYISAEDSDDGTISVGDVVLSNGKVVTPPNAVGVSKAVECIVDGYVLFSNGDLKCQDNTLVATGVSGITKVPQREANDTFEANVDENDNILSNFGCSEFDAFFDKYATVYEAGSGGVKSGTFIGSEIEIDTFYKKGARLDNMNGGADSVILTVKEGKYYLLDTDTNTLDNSNIITGNTLEDMLTENGSIRDITGKVVLKPNYTKFPYFEGEAKKFVFAK